MATAFTICYKVFIWKYTHCQHEMDDNACKNDWPQHVHGWNNLFMGPEAHLSKVPKLFGCISGYIILFVSSKQRHLEARNFEVISIFIPFKTWKDQLSRTSSSQIYKSLFGPEKFSGLSRNRSLESEEVLGHEMWPLTQKRPLTVFRWKGKIQWLTNRESTGFAIAYPTLPKRAQKIPTGCNFFQSFLPTLPMGSRMAFFNGSW